MVKKGSEPPEKLSFRRDNNQAVSKTLLLLYLCPIECQKV